MDIELSCDEKGEGKYLILLHGNGEDKSMLFRQLDFFSRYYRTIALDTRGHGLSKRGEGPFTLKRFSEDLYEFMREKNIGKASVLGFSDGGNTALLFALSHPELVDKLIISGANLYPAGCKRSLIKWVEGEYEDAERRGDGRRKELMALMLHEPDIAPRALKSLTMPVLVTAGTHDDIKTSHTKLIAASIPYSRLVFIEGDHYAIYKKSEEFNKIVLDFLLE